MVSDSPQTIAQVLQWAKHQLSSHRVSDDGDYDSSIIDSKLLLCAALDCELVYLLTWPEKELTLEQQKTFKQFIAQRLTGQPVAYIVGYRDFWSLRLKVSPATLIPRADTECLVEVALALPIPNNAKVLDLGTGTGAIALSLALEQINWTVTGVDKSHAAVALAKENALVNKLTGVDFKQSDWFSAVEQQKYHLIVTNPPYVESNSVFLEKGDVQFEPKSALISGEDGLDDIKLIVQQSTGYLFPKGWLVIEHGYQQANAVAQLLELHGFDKIRTERDVDNQPRVTLARFL
ncbi:peptide chain release factor N(5)-glutamine methyltransferase [Paraglaciecola aquimarina]|uniref:Release factor glutamine methyltransferase n=1 Tax=Paraglaciecola aquimarina TaxID=1235557 RepID=A0ABU3SZY2_9ALTE|nr:peptide chain release factor N(5)-glutamine methyltransferase [Paraglaciecola aquimarina]MDU0355550.1 peptide chain release factor N(5)-glutamine methyltransferase [Paraglaciecola aquimarina]